MSRKIILIDFDGTASLKNVGEATFRRFCSKPLLDEVDRGFAFENLGSRMAYRMLGPGMSGGMADWRNFALENFELDPGLTGLLQELEAMGWEAEILSDGFDCYIEPILQRAGVGIPARHAIVREAPRGAVFYVPHMNPLCGRCATCKTARVEALKESGCLVAYVGDGVSDFCAAPKADIIFAKDALAAHLEAKCIRHHKFDNLTQIAASLMRPQKD